MAVPLSKKVRAILEKRDGNFPRKISDQRYNEYIKEVCKIAGLRKLIEGSKINPEIIRKEKGLFPKYELVTSHIGRRSFATNNYGKIPTSLLINVTGHSTETMFQGTIAGCVIIYIVYKLNHNSDSTPSLVAYMESEQIRT